MVKWNNIEKNWEFEIPKHWWSHLFHNVFSEDMAWWYNKDLNPHPKCLCRTCQVWWYK